MRTRPAVAALLFANLAVLLATSERQDVISSESSAPIAFDLTPDSPTLAIDVDVTAGPVVVARGAQVELSISGLSLVAASGQLSLFDLDESDEVPVATAVVEGALGGLAEDVLLTMSVPILESGTTSHALLLVLEGEAELSGDIVLKATVASFEEFPSSATLELVVK